MTATADQREATVSNNSRRAVLIGALSGLGAWAAGAVAGVARVRAADNEPMLVGGEYTSSSVTSLTNSTNTAIVFRAESTMSEGATIHAESSLGTGLFANCGSGVAVAANTNGLEAVLATSDSDTNAAILARSGTNTMTGVLGVSGNVGPAVRAKTGVHGYAAQDSSSRGVIGESPAGQGVRGETTTGAALFGTAGSGYAIRGSGRLRFDRVSGSVGIPAGSTSVTVSPGVNVNSSSFVLLTPKVNIGTRSLWFTTNASADTFRIRMSASRTTRTPVAWLLVG
jgi:hypothetical protein